ncbi:MAG: hypothetical protein FWE16_05895 [Firmicutes bacterium]|nr:hypothetical protein [Bacillota bacterium]
MKKRNIILIGIIAIVFLVERILESRFDSELLTFVLFLVTLPLLIYYIYFEATFQGMLKNETGEGKKPWGHFWTIILTLGIYHAWWHFLAGERLRKIGAKNRGLHYLILYIIFFTFSFTLVTFNWIGIITLPDNIILDIAILLSGLIPYALLMHMQHTANKLLDERQKNATINSDEKDT